MLNKDNKFHLYLKATLPRQLIFIGLVACIVIIIALGRQAHEGILHEGDIALKSVYAPFDFSLTGDINQPATNKLRQEAEESILEIYDIDPTISNQAITAVETFIKQLNDVRLEEKRSLAEKKFRLRSVIKLKLSLASLEALIESGLDDENSNNIITILKNFYANGIIGSTERKKLLDSGIDSIIAHYPDTGSVVERYTKEFYTIDELRLEISGLEFIKNTDDRLLRQAMIELLGSALRVNLRANYELTSLKRKEAADSVSPIHHTIKIKEKELLIVKGQKAVKDNILKLNELYLLTSAASAKFITYLIGIILIVLSICAVLTIVIKYYTPEVFLSNKKCLLLSIIMVGHLVLAKVIVVSPWPSQVIPMAAGGMITAILLGAPAGLIMAASLAFLGAIITGNNLQMGLLFFLSSLVGIYTVHAVRRRSQIAKASFTVALSSFVLLIGYGFYNNLGREVMLGEALNGLGAGLSSFAMIMVFLPLMEYLFKITTDISLLELSDLNHPILKDMILKAPGTYHHSLVVGNLAENAASAIGANALLARVGGYFHDIGKIEKSEYFAENQQEMKSKHDKLKPTMSSLIITNHVKDGIELAKKYKLPHEITDFIAQHHGTGLIHYFYQRALEKVSDEELLKEEGFRYPGPKPQSREVAIVLLADSVEAASRALPEPNAAQLKGVVRRIFNNKFIDSQLDECDLTLKGLEIISESMLKILSGIYHTRIEYPEKRENNSKQNPKNSKARQNGNKKANS